MTDNIWKDNSTFEISKKVINWIETIDSDTGIEKDDVLPLCTGPMKKLLAFSVNNFRSAEDISYALKNKHDQNLKLKMKEKEIRNKEKKMIYKNINESLDEQRSLRNSLNESIQGLRLMEGQLINLRDDHDAYETRERVAHEFGK